MIEYSGVIKFQLKREGIVRAVVRDPVGRRTSFRVGEGGFSPSGTKMRMLAQFVIQLMYKRLDQGRGSNGLPMPVLSKPYLRYKYIRRLYGSGGRPTRDLKKTGSLRSNHQVRYFDERLAIASFSRAEDRLKAYVNEQRSPWYGLTPAETQQVFVYATSIGLPDLDIEKYYEVLDRIPLNV